MAGQLDKYIAICNECGSVMQACFTAVLTYENVRWDADGLTILDMGDKPLPGFEDSLDFSFLFCPKCKDEMSYSLRCVEEATD